MLATASIVSSLLLGAAHPHLFFQNGDVPALRAAANGTHQEIASYIKTVLGAHVNDAAPTPTDYSDPRFYGDDVCAWGFGYQLTGDPAYAAQGRLRLTTYLTWADWSFGEISSLAG